MFSLFVVFYSKTYLFKRLDIYGKIILFLKNQKRKNQNNNIRCLHLS